MKTQINAPQTQLRDTINQNNKNIETRPKTVSTMILRFKSSQNNKFVFKCWLDFRILTFVDETGRSTWPQILVTQRNRSFLCFLISVRIFRYKYFSTLGHDLFQKKIRFYAWSSSLKILNAKNLSDLECDGMKVLSWTLGVEIVG